MPKPSDKKPTPTTKAPVKNSKEVEKTPVKIETDPIEPKKCNPDKSKDCAKNGKTGKK